MEKIYAKTAVFHNFPLFIKGISKKNRLRIFRGGNFYASGVPPLSAGGVSTTGGGVSDGVSGGVAGVSAGGGVTVPPLGSGLIGSDGTSVTCGGVVGTVPCGISVPPVTPGSAVGACVGSTGVVGVFGVTPVGILPFHKKPEPEVMRILTVFVVVETDVVVVVVSVLVVVDFSVETACSAVVVIWFSPFELAIFSRPMLAKTFSEGVMGNSIKTTRIIPVRRINPMHEAIVIFVDLFRFDINPDFLLILSPFFLFF